MKVTLLGSGAWGTALAKVLDANGHAITLWGHNAQHLDEMARALENKRLLPGIKLSKDWRFEAHAAEAVADAEAVVVAVPSKALRQVVEPVRDFRGAMVSVTKGIEFETGLTMSGVIDQVVPNAEPAALSGPTLAAEVARGMPAAIVAASQSMPTAEIVQGLFHRPEFRVYTSTDLVGVELAGALKNVIAIAAGVCEGLGYGDNSKAALVTRAIVEIRRLGVACGAQPETFSGLSGLGDLTVTCFSKLSRNRTFGERLGRGEKAEGILANMVSVVEGYPTTRSAYQLSQKLGVETPIIDEIYAALYTGKDVSDAVRSLLARESKAED